MMCKLHKYSIIKEALLYLCWLKSEFHSRPVTACHCISAALWGPRIWYLLVAVPDSRTKVKSKLEGSCDYFKYSFSLQLICRVVGVVQPFLQSLQLNYLQFLHYNRYFQYFTIKIKLNHNIILFNINISLIYNPNVYGNNLIYTSTFWCITLIFIFKKK